MSCSYIGVLSSRNLPLSHFPPASLVLAKEHQLLTNSWQRGKINDCLVFILPPNSEVFFILPASGKGPRDYSVFLVAFFFNHNTLFTFILFFTLLFNPSLPNYSPHDYFLLSPMLFIFPANKLNVRGQSQKKKRPTTDNRWTEPRGAFWKALDVHILVLNIPNSNQMCGEFLLSPFAYYAHPVIPLKVLVFRVIFFCLNEWTALVKKSTFRYTNSRYRIEIVCSWIAVKIYLVWSLR